ncbi:MAG: radical SAM protein [bacterium]|nr:radical SAM protein [bacterium]
MPRTIQRITLIEPEPAGFHVFSHFQMPRLGLPILGAILKKQGCDVNIHLGALSKKDFLRYRDTDLIGISTTTSTAPEAYRLADIFRSIGKPVVIGGVHASFMRDEALQHADYVVAGEAEQTFPELIRLMAEGELPVNLSGISFLHDGAVTHNPVPAPIADLDSLPFPDFSLLDSGFELFNTPIQTSRGCPYPCNFCTVTQMFGRKVRFRSVDSVLDEMSQIPKNEIFFYDDNFCAKPSFTKQLCEGILSRGLKPRFSSAQVRVEVTRDLELMDLLARSGTDLVYVGFESVNAETLKAYDKHQTVEDIASAMEIFRRFKIRVHGMFVIGSDYDSRHTAAETLQFARKYSMDTVQFMMLTPIPGTELYQQLQEQNRIVSRDWRLYDGQHAVYLPKLMTSEELQRTTMKAMGRFYSIKEGLRGLIGRDMYIASRRIMGWYLIKRWQWANRRWNANLASEALNAQRLALQHRLKELQNQLNEITTQVHTHLPKLELKTIAVRFDELYKSGEIYLKEIGRISNELMAAPEDDLRQIMKRIEELRVAVAEILNEYQAIYQSLPAGA